MSIGEDYSPHRRRRRFYCLGKSLSFIIDSLSNSVFVSFAFFMTKASLSSLVLLSLLWRDCPCEMRSLPKAISPLRWPFSSRWPFYICPYYLIMPLKAQAPVIRCCCCCWTAKQSQFRQIEIEHTVILLLLLSSAIFSFFPSAADADAAVFLCCCPHLTFFNCFLIRRLGCVRESCE